MNKKTILLLLISIFFWNINCKLGDDAFLRLDESLKGLPLNNYEQFMSIFIPEHKKKYYEEITKIPFFQNIKKYHIVKNKRIKEAIGKGAVYVIFEYGDDLYGGTYFFLQKVNGNWYIDFDKTYREELKNGQGFVIRKIEKEVIEKQKALMKEQ